MRSHFYGRELRACAHSVNGLPHCVHKQCVYSLQIRFVFTAITMCGFTTGPDDTEMREAEANFASQDMHWHHVQLGEG